MIDVPTIVTHREGDRLVPIENSRYIAERIPEAAYVELPGQDHLWWLGDQQALVDVVERFLATIPERRDPERILATLVVAHAADSPGPRLDAGAPVRELTAAHETATRGQADRFGGTHVRPFRHGLLATFAGPSRAIRFADAIRLEARSDGLELAIGVHTGECDVDGTGITGIAVDVATEISSLAAAGEILVTSTRCPGRQIRPPDHPSVVRRALVAVDHGHRVAALAGRIERGDIGELLGWRSDGRGGSRSP